MCLVARVHGQRPDQTRCFMATSISTSIFRCLSLMRPAAFLWQPGSGRTPQAAVGQAICDQVGRDRRPLRSIASAC